jgi:hypothetical protein
MSRILTMVFFAISVLLFGQNTKVEDLGKIYMSGELDRTIELATEYLAARMEQYTTSREDAYSEINEFFKSSLPKKIDFFV